MQINCLPYAETIWMPITVVVESYPLSLIWKKSHSFTIVKNMDVIAKTPLTVPENSQQFGFPVII